MTLEAAKTIFMLGIGGTGMRGLARLLSAHGKTVVGSDQQYDVIKNWPDLKEYDIVPEGEGERLLKKADLLVHTDAAEKDHPLIKAAQRENIPVLAYQEALGDFSRSLTTVAVTGTHGKSSTTAFLAHILIEAGADPNVLVGAPMPAWGGSSRVGKSDLFIVEADEYREHFLTFSPAHAIIVSVDFDHPDYFKSLEDVQAAYARFKARIASGGVVLTTADVQHEIDDVPSPLPGRHMQHNAALAVKMAEVLGVPREQAVAALKTFPGIGRRFERLDKIGKMDLFTDYGHHPAEIKATFLATRGKFAGQRILTLFEAHTLERLKTFFDGYVEALSGADGVLLVPVFIPAGREHESAEAREWLQKLERKLPGIVWRIDDWKELPAQLTQLSDEFDVAIAFTAGLLDAKLRTLSFT
ncbi:MAG: Mur ligase family protein [Patescibacteria group bacterium]